MLSDIKSKVLPTCYKFRHVRESHPHSICPMKVNKWKDKTLTTVFLFTKSIRSFYRGTPSTWQKYVSTEQVSNTRVVPKPGSRLRFRFRKGSNLRGDRDEMLFRLSVLERHDMCQNRVRWYDRRTSTNLRPNCISGKLSTSTLLYRFTWVVVIVA